MTKIDYPSAIQYVDECPSSSDRVHITATRKEEPTYTVDVTNVSSEVYNPSDETSGSNVTMGGMDYMWMPCGTGFVSMPNVFNQNQQQLLYMKYYEAEMARNNRICLESFEYEKKKELIQANSAAQIKVAEKKEELKMKRLLSSVSVFEDEDGYLVKQLKDYDNNIVSCKMICAEKHLRLLKCYATGQSRQYSVFYLTWDNRKKGTNTFFTEDSLTSENLKKTLINSGIHIKTARDYSDNLMDAILTHLKKYCKPYAIPLSEGWNKLDGSWVFIRHGDLCMRRVIKNAKY